MAGSGLDLGRTGVRLVTAESGRGGPRLLRYLSAEVEPGETAAEAAAAALGAAARKAGRVRVGLGGADLMLRYLPVPQVEDWRLTRLMEFETREIASRSGAELASSYNLLPVPKELDEDDTMMLGLVREDLLEAQAERLAPIAVESFTPNAIALYNAWLALGDHQPRTTLIAHFGAGALDLALVRGTDLYFARSLTTPLEKRDATLATRLGTDAVRARALIHKHLDLRVTVGERLGADADRVTRPVLPLYEGLPTLLSGAVTLCKAQARLRELALERVLITGGGAGARGLVEMLHDRLRVPVEVWNPAAEVDASALSAEDAARLAADGPAATVALGLALSAADPELYALEILTAGARRKREFAERGVWSIAAGVAAATFLGLAFWRHGALADETEEAAKRARTQVSRVQAANQRTEELLKELAVADQLGRELATRVAIGESARRFLGLVETALPESLWLETWSVELKNGKDWGSTDLEVPVISVAGRSDEEPRVASQQLSEFTGRLQSLIGDQSRVLPSQRPSGKELEWSLKTVLLAVPAADNGGEDKQK
jgi:Tfp pilus assembly PilM family ATPase